MQQAVNKIQITSFFRLTCISFRLGKWTFTADLSWHLLVQNQQSIINTTLKDVYKIRSKLTDTRTTRFGVFIVNFEQISYKVLAFSMLTLNK